VNKQLQAASYGIPILIGVIFFAVVFDVNMLDPTHVEWLSHGDILQAYLGWDFFRKAPWTFPVVGLNPYYGMEVSSSIVFSDSNPLLALVFKLLSPLLPAGFQYFGLWLLACCILSAVATWKIVGLYSDSYLIRSLAAALVLLNPAWIHRIGHINLMGHFLILFAIYLCLLRDRRHLAVKWCLLIAVACLTHFYLAMIVMILWGANLFSRVVTRATGYGSALLEALAAAIGAYLLMYTAGYFTVDDVSVAGGYGAYNSNLLSPLISDGWSYVFDHVYLGLGNFETVNYWGLGVLLLVLFNLKGLYRSFGRFTVTATSLSVLIAAITFFLIATTNNIQLFDHHLIVPLPGKLLDALSTFRGSSRFYWPLTYLAVIGLVYLTVRYRARSVALAALAVALVVQAGDISKGFKRENFYFFNSPDVTAALRSEFWSNELGHYAKLRYVPFTNDAADRLALAFVASRQGLMTDSVMLARPSESKQDSLNLRTLQALSSARYDDDTVYVLKSDILDFVRLKPNDQLFKIDGLNVLAPGLKGCQGCERLAPTAASKAGYLLISGWSTPEDFGIWNDGRVATMLVHNQGSTTRATLRYRVFLTPQVPTQRLIFKADGQTIKEVQAQQNGEVSLSWPVAEGQATTALTIELPDAISPREAGLSADGRVLGMGLENLQIERAVEQGVNVGGAPLSMPVPKTGERR